MYSLVQGLLEPDLMSPRWATRSTLGSLLIRSMRSGRESNFAAPYGISPMTASVYGSLEPRLIGLPMVIDGAGAAVRSGEQAATIPRTSRFAAIRRIDPSAGVEVDIQPARDQR